jgi:murein DD-endopeptidase MepM/ murein hydrolase activator NlpD
MEDNKNSRVFYVTLTVIALVISLIIVTAIVAKRNEVTPPDNSGTDSTTTVNPEDKPTGSEQDDLPDFTLPVNGAIGFDYSDSIPVFSQTMGDYRTHLGVDVLAPLGTEVVAVADGTVKNIWDDPFMGKCIAIEHSGNAVSIYKNLAPEIGEWLEVGCPVNKGDVIGNVGESAMNEIAEEPHLHYELKVDDTYVDPKDHFTFPTVDTNYEDSITE